MPGAHTNAVETITCTCFLQPACVRDAFTCRSVAAHPHFYAPLSQAVLREVARTRDAVDLIARRISRLSAARDGIDDGRLRVAWRDACIIREAAAGVHDSLVVSSSDSDTEWPLVSTVGSGDGGSTYRPVGRTLPPTSRMILSASRH